jgi:catechol 2,3-dioxygenase-like lactoylglutathione lyase family enzyme
MPSITQPRLHHLAITVTDLDASIEWYEAVFGVSHLRDVPHPGGVGEILADPDRRLMPLRGSVVRRIAARTQHTRESTLRAGCAPPLRRSDLGGGDLG